MVPKCVQLNTARSFTNLLKPVKLLIEWAGAIVIRERSDMQPQGGSRILGAVLRCMKRIANERNAGEDGHRAILPCPADAVKPSLALSPLALV